MQVTYTLGMNVYAACRVFFLHARQRIKFNNPEHEERKFKKTKVYCTQSLHF